MSRIEQRIAELCPKGVEFREIGEVVEKISNIRWQKIQGEKFNYIDLSSVDRDSHAIGATEIIDSQTAPSRAQQLVRKGDTIFGTTRPMLKRYCLIPSEFDGQICSTGYCVLRPNSALLLPNFLFHLLGTETFYSHVDANQRGASYPAITDAAVKAFRIPIPPLEVQREIVRILDLFTALIANLRAELVARRKQYHYYRDQLLNFEGKEGVRWGMLGEVATYTTSRISASGLDEHSYVGVDNLLPDMRGRMNSSYVPTTGTAIGYKVDDILIGNIRPYLKKIWHADSTGGTNQDVLVVRLKEDFGDAIQPRFLYHALASDQFFIYNTKHAKGAKMPRGDKAAILNYPIPIAPLPEQSRIAGILDKFDALVSDLSAGIPAEIAARGKQYEYYRDRLLTFREVGG